MRYGFSALLLTALSLPALAQTALPTASDIEAAYHQAVQQDSDAHGDDPMFKAMVASLKISKVYGCQPREDSALRCLVDMQGGLKPGPKAVVLSLSKASSGWTLLKERSRDFPTPSPEDLAAVLKTFADERIAAGQKDPQLTAASTGSLKILDVSSCSLDTGTSEDDEGAAHRNIAVRCDVTLKPGPDAAEVHTEMPLMPAGQGWTFGEHQDDAV